MSIITTARRIPGCVLLPLAAAGLLLTGCDAATSSAATHPSGTPASAASAPASTPSGDASSGIGAWPTFLPSPTPAGPATGSTASPAMSYAGSPVDVSLPHGRAVINVNGPSYPASTKVGAEAVACTFTLTVTAKGADLPLTAKSFDVLDHTGAVHAFTTAAGTTLPTTVKSGSTETLKLTTTVPSGEGLVRFYVGGYGAAAWDYVAETD